MQELADRIRKAKDLNELLPLMEALSRETASFLAKRRLEDGDIERILYPIAVMRSLLGRLDLALAGYQDGGKADLVRQFAARCLDLEGRLKEARNDRRRPPFAA